MCKGTTAGEGILLDKNEFHESIRHLYTRDIYVDQCIAEEVRDLLSNGIATQGMSCCGHGKQQAQAWILPESVDKAKEMGYKIFVAFTMYGEASPAIMLNTGTQSDILLYEGYIHGDENGMIDGKSPPEVKFKPCLGWN